MINVKNMVLLRYIYLYISDDELSFLQGVGGAVQLPDGYLKRAFDMVRARGGVCIADEVSGTRMKHN